MPKKTTTEPKLVGVSLRVIILPKEEAIHVYAANHPDSDSLSAPDPQVLPIKDGVSFNATRLESRFGGHGIPRIRWVELVRDMIWQVQPHIVVLNFTVWADLHAVSG